VAALAISLLIRINIRNIRKANNNTQAAG
jgi:MFS transporter, OFA family, oxalate/formate antiporter